jgi:hypothetical protein
MLELSEVSIQLSCLGWVCLELSSLVTRIRVLRLVIRVVDSQEALVGAQCLGVETMSRVHGGGRTAGSEDELPATQMQQYAIAEKTRREECQAEGG